MLLFFLCAFIFTGRVSCGELSLLMPSGFSDTLKSSGDSSVTEIETIIFVPYSEPKKKDTTSVRDTANIKSDTASKTELPVKKDTASKTDLLSVKDTSSVSDTAGKNDPPVKTPLVMGPGVYRLLRVDSIVFAKAYLLIMENFQQDTIFILSDRIVRHYDGTDENYGEPVALNGLYKLKFYKIDNMFQEKLGFRYRTIEHLEIRFGSIIFYTDQLIQVPIHYTSNLNGLYYSPPPDDETIINLDINR